jgi:hypothetical protein
LGTGADAAYHRQVSLPPLRYPAEREGGDLRDRRISREEEKRPLDAAMAMNKWQYRWVGRLMHDRIIGASSCAADSERCSSSRTSAWTLMQGHASVQQTQRYLNVTDEELRRGLAISWKRRTVKVVAGGQNACRRVTPVSHAAH